MPAKWVELSSLRPKILGTSDTIERMHRLVALAKIDPAVIKIAHSIRLGCPGWKAFDCLAKSVYRWVKSRGVFVRHPHQVQRLTSVREMIAEMADLKKSGAYKGTAWFLGDCPMFAIWTAALAGALGFPYGFETVIADALRPDEFSHVYAVLHVPSRGWVAADTSTEEASLGWRPPVAKDRFKLWAEPDIERVLSGQDYQEVRRMHGMNGYLNGHLNGTGMGQQPQVERVWPQVLPREFFQTTPETRVGDPEYETPSQDLRDWYPTEPALSEGDLEQPVMRDMVRCGGPKPWQRIPFSADMLPPKPWYRWVVPGVSVDTGYYPGFPWSRQVNVEGQGGPITPTPTHDLTEPGISRHPFKVAGHEPGALVRIQDRRNPMVSFTNGMAAMAIPVPTATQKAADAAGSGVLTDIANTIAKVAGTVSPLVLASYQAKIEAAKAKALQAQAAMVAGAPITTTVAPSADGGVPWYVYAGGAAAGGFILWQIFKPRGRSRR